MDPDEVIPLRIQYLLDSDPFNSVSLFPIPSRAPTYNFISTAPLATQLGAILRILEAPQRPMKIRLDVS
uniref:FHOD1 N-terminal GTPase-binding domain-containing protein n=1 Tax=Phlebotomus papatasi TaxID=29031 RepID=A0A1B0GLV1_PHLPP